MNDNIDRKWLENKWKEIGSKIETELGSPKDQASALKEIFDQMNLSLKNTFIEIMNFCLSEGTTDELEDELSIDSENITPFKTDLKYEFSSGCAWKLVELMYKED